MMQAGIQEPSTRLIKPLSLLPPINAQNMERHRGWRALITQRNGQRTFVGNELTYLETLTANK